MRGILAGWLLVGVVLYPASAFGQEAPSGEEPLEEELSLQDEEGGILDEFALLEEELASDEVESASKHRQSIYWSPSAITVLTRDEIRASGALTLPDLLRRIPGFDVYESKPSFPLLGARALTDDSTNLVLVLIDGREALVELVGFPVWFALSIDLAEVERLEVIRGPGSTLYGANAFAAVINITTVTERLQPGGDITLSLGEQGHQRLFGRARGARQLGDGLLSFFVGAGTEKRISPTDSHNDMKQVPIRAHGVVRYQEGKDLDLSLHAGGAFMSAGTMYMHVGDLAGSNLHNHFAMAQADLALGEKFRLKSQLYHGRFASDFHYRLSFTAQGVWVADVPDFTVDTNTVDGQAQLDFQATDDLMLMGGANLRYTIMESDKVIPTEMTELRGAGFMHVQYHPWEVLQLTGGIRFDFNTETESALSPRAVVVYRPVPEHAFRLGYSLAFRKPSFIEGQIHMLIEDYNPGMPEVVDVMATQFGNEDLINEKVHSVEVGWRTHLLGERLRLAVDLFYNLYLDTIFFNEILPLRMGFPDIRNSTIQYENSEYEVTAMGGELELSLRLTDQWTVWCNLGLRQVTEVVFDEETEEETTQDRSQEPMIRANMGIRFSPTAGAFMDLALHYVSAYEMLLMDPENPIGVYFPVALGEKLLLIGRAGYRWAWSEYATWEAGFSIRAPIGGPFREFGGMPIPPSLAKETSADFGGEPLVRLVSIDLRAAF